MLNKDIFALGTLRGKIQLISFLDCTKIWTVEFEENFMAVEKAVDEINFSSFRDGYLSVRQKAPFMNCCIFDGSNNYKTFKLKGHV